MPFADKVTAGRYNFVYMTMKIILLGLAFALSLPGADKRPYFGSFKF